MHIPPEHPMLSAIVDDLATRGWSQQSLFLSDELARALALECRRRHAEGELNPAGVGRGAAQEVREAIRGDQIQWIDPGDSEACDQYLGAMDSLRQAINQGLYLGLEDFECHFALYPPGAFYRRHLDRFRDDDRRAVSAVFYLNEGWQPDDGGQLRMFLQGDVEHDVPPLAGTLVVFLSGDIPHEVLPAGRERLSLTGWFRRRGNDPF
ncbi:2OG-Fe(II) oxygenase [Pseudomonas entomophila]|uniref:2OG-Fe(II) oxygenase n=2 Tax=Pseudomonas entomophila TaxID=312306 RepID=A0ABY9QSN1_9PSED|nr:2OG-Fe(II) oxygenase [Pseudomonas entomophila]WMW06429.1 2OG-Fe(II) oxygenase [Pseudomonas entomophila]CAK17877.1 putative oxidoreductase, 2OG-Fe(II) oxygenase family [Pseudomonas entomophila L48]